jgi:hypothetical protein
MNTKFLAIALFAAGSIFAQGRFSNNNGSASNGYSSMREGSRGTDGYAQARANNGREYDRGFNEYRDQGSHEQRQFQNPSYRHSQDRDAGDFERGHRVDSDRSEDTHGNQYGWR